ncbi:hypothetical protein BHE74_00012282 [Ensete ventricosum]|uniref:Uncharacterized protein n=1 Tax=Ensete ventricosum TaxID=4639 RepID=A0A444FP20_ENSVE|nr:hypothetical protein GW17_00011367 [Ensete ventricosum]RWW79434.1 hypothetical protein BHE74_00012282 [Ensete ventricosum]RZR72689.1 hypothetical protein BHM03_00015892 [Ensete ventricosum]
MGFLRSHCSYSRVDKEDPEERQHLKARFLIHRTLEEADTRQRRSSSRLRACGSKKKIGLKLKRLRVVISSARICAYWQVIKRFRHLNLSLARPTSGGPVAYATIVRTLTRSVLRAGPSRQ